MTQKPILKITEQGKSFVSEDPRDFKIYLPKYPCLKLDEIKAGTMTINAGSSVGVLDITHNKGLVDFDVYQGNYLWPDRVRAYNDGTKVRITFELGYTYNKYDVDYPSDLYDAKYGGRSYTCCGKDNTGNGRDHAIKFNVIPVAKNANILAASIDHYAQYRWVSSPAQNMLLRTYGIAQDSCESFDSYPMSRTQTSAVTTQSNVVPQVGEFFGTDVKNQVQEIVNRSGWVIGNHMGFLIFDNGTPAGNYIEDDSWRHKLSITVAGSMTLPFYVALYKDKII